MHTPSNLLTLVIFLWLLCILWCEWRVLENCLLLLLSLFIKHCRKFMNTCINLCKHDGMPIFHSAYSLTLVISMWYHCSRHGQQEETKVNGHVQLCYNWPIPMRYDYFSCLLGLQVAADELFLYSAAVRVAICGSSNSFWEVGAWFHASHHLKNVWS